MLRRQASVMEGVEFGLIRRIEMGRVEDPVTEGNISDCLARELDCRAGTLSCEILKLLVTNGEVAVCIRGEVPAQC